MPKLKRDKQRKAPAEHSVSPKAATNHTASTRSKRAPASKSLSHTASNSGVAGLRVRMFRVGFGDFFLVTVPTANGSRSILVDCGVHAKDLGSIRAAVTQMVQDCDSQLALVIMTHRHADHISGFGTCRDIFSEVAVERVWMSWFEDRGNSDALAFQASLSAVANRLALGLAARNDPGSREFIDMAENITGGMAAAGGQSRNQVALDVLHGGFKNKVTPDYYRAGDVPTLPQDLVDAGLTAQILGPPIDPSLVKQMTYKNEQYLGATTETDGTRMLPFASVFRADETAYPSSAFEIFSAQRIADLVAGSQPDTLAARAKAADNTLNNQSLVVLFTFGGKNLLFAGDAQWGNWENFLYGGAYGTPGHTEMTDKAKQVLGQIDFYKVGHHGSANATPKDAVAAMREGCVGMCSTQPCAYNQVPRGPLLEALGQRMHGQLARSDQVRVGETQPSPDVGPLPSDFTSPGQLFIDYEF